MSNNKKRQRLADNINSTLDEEHEYPQKSLRHDGTRDSASLANLLDFSSLTTHSDINIRFEQLADALFCDHFLLLKHGDLEHEYDILELEFYLQKSGCHEDPFTHGADDQRYSGRWYFHRAPTNSSNPNRHVTAAGGYRGGTRKGLDLTMGGPIISPHFESANVDSSSSRLRGGILLRSLRRSSDAVVISGPSLLVDEVLRLSQACNISELVEQKWGRNTAAFPPLSTSGSASSTSLYIRPKVLTKQTAKPIIYRSSRVGLDLSNPNTTHSSMDPRVIYISKPYRYFVHPHLLTSNGRGHTFLGIHRTCLDADQFGSDDDILREIIRLSGLKEPTAVKYLAEYQAGLQTGVLRSFIGSAGKGASSSPATYLRMMGTLTRISRDDGP